MSKPEPVLYRTTNWKSCNDALKQRGSLLIWRNKDMVWLAPRAGRNGRPVVFSDAAIQFCLMVKVLFGLPLRQTTGMEGSILTMTGWTGRCHTAILDRGAATVIPIRKNGRLWRKAVRPRRLATRSCAPRWL